MKKLNSIHVYDNAKSLRALRDVFDYLSENFGYRWSATILKWPADKDDERHLDDTLEITFSCNGFISDRERENELIVQDINFWLKGYFAHVKYPYDAPGT